MSEHHSRRKMTVVMFALFHFLFLGIEYDFDGQMAYLTDAAGVVRVQSMVLVASVLGFFAYAMLRKCRCGNRLVYGIEGLAFLTGLCCMLQIYRRSSYITVLLCGCVLFLILGMLGGASYELAVCAWKYDRHMAAMVGVSYALGLLLQYLHHTLVHIERFSIAIWIVAWLAWICLQLRLRQAQIQPAVETEEASTEVAGASMDVGVLLCLSGCVLGMTLIFATLDSVVTQYHANGDMDIGEWPRLFLALSGVVAGLLYDVRDRHYMHILMYSVTVLSVICILMIVSGGALLAGVIAFYLSAGFFVVYFTTVFMEMSAKSRWPALWAGFGRVLNNLGAGLVGVIYPVLFARPDTIQISVLALLLFVVISVLIFFCTNRPPQTVPVQEKPAEKPAEATGVDRFDAFADAYQLTPRERDVLRALLDSDDSVQNIADSLFISRAALYRHIASMNEKTNTKARIGLLQFYYGWKEDGDIG